VTLGESTRAASVQPDRARFRDRETRAERRRRRWWEL